MAVERLKKTLRETMAGAMMPDTFNDDAHTVDVRLYAGARMIRGKWFEEPYTLEFDLSPTAADLTRLNSGAPVLKDHNASLDSQIGVFVAGSARMESDGIYAKVRFSERPEFAGIVADIRAGIIRNVSMGADVHVRTIERNDGQLDRHIATAYEVLEGSFVAIQADPDAQSLDHQSQNETAPATPAQEENMPIPADKAAEIKAAAKAEALADEKTRIAAIHGAAERLQLPFDNAEVLRCIADDVPLMDAREALWNARQELDAKSEPDVRPSHEGSARVTKDHRDHVMAGAEEALSHRMRFGADTVEKREGGRLIKVRTPIELSAAGRAHRGMSLTDIGRELLIAAGADERKIRGARKSDIARAMTNPEHTLAMGTSDFSNLLSTSANKTLLAGYNYAPQEWKQICTERSIPDYKTQTAIRVSDTGNLPVVPEGGEIKEVSTSEQAETYQAGKRGTAVALTHEAMVNDDLDGFAVMLMGRGRAAGATESSMFVSMLETTDTMSNGRVPFNTTDGTLLASGAAPSAAQLIAVRKAFGDLTGLASEELDLTLVYGLFGNDTIDAAEQLLSPNYTPTGSTTVLTPRTQFVPILEKRLAATVWYGATDAMFSGLHYGYVDGQIGPILAQEEDSRRLSIRYDVWLHFAAWRSDRRGVIKNPGT